MSHDKKDQYTFILAVLDHLEAVIKTKTISSQIFFASQQSSNWQLHSVKNIITNAYKNLSFTNNLSWVKFYIPLTLILILAPT